MYCISIEKWKCLQISSIETKLTLLSPFPQKTGDNGCWRSANEPGRIHEQAPASTPQSEPLRDATASFDVEDDYKWVGRFLYVFKMIKISEFIEIVIFSKVPFETFPSFPFSAYEMTRSEMFHTFELRQEVTPLICNGFSFDVFFSLLLQLRPIVYTV